MRILIFIFASWNFSFAWHYANSAVSYLMLTDEISVIELGNNTRQRPTSREVDMIELESIRVQERPSHYKVRIHFKDGRPSLLASMNRHEFANQTAPFDPEKFFEEVQVTTDPKIFCSLNWPLVQADGVSINPQHLEAGPFEPRTPLCQEANQMARAHDAPGQHANCLKKLKALHEKYPSVWEDLKESKERAAHMLAIARLEIATLKQRDSNSDEKLDASLIACIIKQENGGDNGFFPETISKSICREYIPGLPRRLQADFSTAQGLSQMVKKTVDDHHQRNIFQDVLPVEYVDSESTKMQNFCALNGRPVWQIRLMIAKINNDFEGRSLRGAIRKYRGFNSPIYFNKITSCQACFREYDQNDNLQVERCLLDSE